MKKPRTPKTRPLFISRQSMVYSKGYYRENMGTKIGHVSVIIHSNFGTLPSTTQHNICEGPPLNYDFLGMTA